ncbi:MAG: hypothetical protein WAX69_24300 [Victivallales bacterium]
MNKTKKSTKFLILLTGFLFLSVIALYAEDTRQAATGQESVFLPNEKFKISGEALSYKLKKPGQTQFQQAGGTSINVPSGTVVAMENRFANVVLNDAADLILHPYTEVSINYFTKGITLCVTKGKVDCMLKKDLWKGKYLNIVHENLIATAVGTIFVVTVQGHDIMVDVFEGSVIMHVTHTGGSAPNNNIPEGMRLQTPTRVVFNRDGSMDVSDGTWTQEDWEVTTPEFGIRFQGRGIGISTGTGHLFKQIARTDMERLQRTTEESLRDIIPDPLATSWRRAAAGRYVNDEQRTRLEAAREQCGREMRLIYNSIDSGAARNMNGLEAQRNLALTNYFAIIAEICGVNPPPRGRRFRAEDYSCDRIRREVIPPVRLMVEVSSKLENSDGMRDALDASTPPMGREDLLRFLTDAVADNQISDAERRQLQEILDWMASMVDAADTPVPNP